MHKLTNLAVALIAVVGLATSGCIFISSSAISSSAHKAGTAITANASDTGYLMLVAPQGLTQTAATQLMDQCPSGKVGDVVTELTMRNVLGLVQLYNVQASGVCSR